jgi:hypothetical protein
LALFGTAAVTATVVAYALERRSATFVLAFAGGCALSSVYGFLIGSLPFGAVEAAWAALAVRRYALRIQDGRE